MRTPMALLGCFLFSVSSALAEVPKWLPKDPGTASGWASGVKGSLWNNVLRVDFNAASLPSLGITSTLDGSRRTVDGLFLLVLDGGVFLKPSNMKLRSSSAAYEIVPDPQATKLSERLAGRGIRASWVDAASGVQVDWVATLRKGATYIRQEFTISSLKADAKIQSVVLLRGVLHGTEKLGEVLGSPIVAGNLFMGLEHPMSVSRGGNDTVRCEMPRRVPLRKGQSVAYSSVIGVAPAGQMRRAFLRYVERERAHPYRPFLHYNSWYDIGFFTPYTEQECVDVVNAYGQHMVKERGVDMSSFLFDDGWDDTSTVWEFSKAFPSGFAPVTAAAKKYGAAPGVWLSPWGGYGGPRERRLATGKSLGYEIDDQGYALSGPKYYERFRQVCLDMVRKYGINQFKFDGTGSPDKQYPGSAFDSDFDAAISLIGDLRQAKKDLFINLTTGTWPSPFWTRYADSIWRGGSDHSFAGVGTSRQQWITYRDGDTYHGVVQRGPLYPINSLMLHGIIYAKHAHNLNTDPGNDFRDEVRAYFSTGTQLQEMYVSPDLLTRQNWDDLAEAANWARLRAPALADSHWIGGDPTKLEVYGHAGWSGGRAFVELRNPADHPQAYSLDVADALQFPAASTAKVIFKSPWKADAKQAGMTLTSGKSKVLMLKPFQVLVLDGEVK